MGVHKSLSSLREHILLVKNVLGTSISMFPFKSWIIWVDRSLLLGETRFWVFHRFCPWYPGLMVDTIWKYPGVEHFYLLTTSVLDDTACLRPLILSWAEFSEVTVKLDVVLALSEHLGTVNIIISSNIMVWLVVHESIVGFSVKICIFVLVDCQILLLDLMETSWVVIHHFLLEHVHVLFTLYVDTVLKVYVLVV